MNFVRAAITIVCLGVLNPSLALDERGAKKFAKKNDCFKCHAMDKKKDGPSYAEIAKKYKDKADAKDTLFTHLTTNPTVKVDGKEEKHESPKTDDEAEIRNVVDWILAQ